MKVKNIALLMLSPCYLAVAMANASNWEDSIKENSFIADSELELSTRNMWKYLKTENRFDKNENRYRKQVANAWGQNFQADFKSGYFADVIGFDASYYAVSNWGQVKTSPPVQFYIMMMAMRKGTTKLVNVMQK